MPHTDPTPSTTTPGDNALRTRRRWSRTRIAERALLGTVALATVIFAFAYMLHSSTARGPGAAAAKLAAVQHWSHVSLDVNEQALASASAAPSIDPTSKRGPALTLTTYAVAALANGPPHEAGAKVDRLHLVRVALDASESGLTAATGDGATTDPGVPLYGQQTAIVDRALAAGWDGIVFHIPRAKTQDHADLATTLDRAADYARRARPNVIIGISGDETFLARSGVVDTIDAVFKTGFFPARRHAAEDSAAVLASRHYLDRAHRAGRRVFIAGEAQTAERALGMTDLARTFGYVPSVTVVRY